MPRTTRSVLIVASLLLPVFTRSAHGQSTANLPIANALFLEGQALFAAGDYAAACPKFEASLALSRRLGTLMNLARCYERNGQIASAWAFYSEAADLAAKVADQQDRKLRLRIATAQERIAALAPRLSRLVIDVPPGAAAPGLAVYRDGVPLPASARGVAIPVDPGDHAIVASAPGRVPWRQTVTVAPDGDIVRIAVPVLELAAPAAAPVAAAASVAAVPAVGPAEARPGRARAIATLGLAGTGIAASAFGAYSGWRARSLWAPVRGECGDGLCSEADRAQAARAHRFGTLSTAALTVGGAAIATALVLYLTAPERPARAASIRLTPAVAADGAALFVDGAF